VTPIASTRLLTAALVRHRRVLAATARVELGKRYAGSALGLFWIILQPLLLLSVYLFVYMVVFRVRFPGLTQFDYVLYVFAGLVPFLALMETVGGAPTLIKANIHLVRNVLLPIEVVAARSVLTGLAGQTAALAMVVVLSAAAGTLSWHVVWLPVVVLLQALLLVGLVWIVSSIGVVLPDTAYVVNILLLLLLYISPIGFTPEMVPAGFRLLIVLNPVYYMAEMFRAVLLGGAVDYQVVAIYTLICAGGFVVGATFFRAFKGILVDYE
jgi:lipopolysaccharide transport system permease protein